MLSRGGCKVTNTIYIAILLVSLIPTFIFQAVIIAFVFTKDVCDAWPLYTGSAGKPSAEAKVTRSALALTLCSLLPLLSSCVWTMD